MGAWSAAWRLIDRILSPRAGAVFGGSPHCRIKIRILGNVNDV